MKRIAFLLIASWAIAAAGGCGLDYGAIINDAHDMASGAQQVIDAKCAAGNQADGCVKLHEASTVLSDLLQIADFALDTGEDLDGKSKTAWAYAKSLFESAKALLGIKAIPALANASAAITPPVVAVGEAAVAKP